MKARVVIMLFAIFIMQLPVHSFAASVTIEVNKKEIRPGDELDISGEATGMDEVLVKIVGPDSTVFYLDVLPVAREEYKTTVGFPKTDTVPGKYTILAGNGGIQAETSVMLAGEKEEDDGEDDSPDKDDNGGDKSDGGTDGNQENNGGTDDENDGDNGGAGNNDDNGTGEQDNGKNHNGENGNVNEDNDRSDDQNNKANGESLPDTSTSIFNYFLAGLILCVIGLLLWYQKRKKA
ncbi:hypothetical protein GCM10011409_18230 [Lentibacillus populi]|uniref:Gram-positive cocci surface proteins LPxTG domain-containing protein n=1 Tax=Lentibacillus populi TaxID=1827502 RepID=A0A9W5TWU3_9BACI|nr:LPXTG cell wall anchor domain-containing protein [Lentibacillus populi]MBT2214533.1 LPXTG cell wall anchor domain-containing protein [Virgibacillus dakarensis]GGB41072.1 hypothetical protein GCM10011409_18230 [Lentibacillus populi]